MIYKPKNKVSSPIRLISNLRLKLLANDFPLNEENLWDFYLENLFRKNQVSTFELPNQRKIVGIIKGVNRQGKLIVLHEDDIEVLYNLKEIKLLY